MVLPEISSRRLLVLCGPTAVGKTVAAIELAQRIGGEIIAADSRTIYRRMDIGTAKPTPVQRALVPHHLLDVAEPDAVFTLATYRELALTAIDQISARNSTPILVGGTGLYIRAVVDGLIIPPVAPDWEFRRHLENVERQAPGTLYAHLRAIDPVAATRIHPHNVRRVIRALEVHARTGRPITAMQHRTSPPFWITQIGFMMDRGVLYRRIEQRVDEQLAGGLLEEVRGLLDSGCDRALPAMQGVGYKELVEYLDGAVTLEEAARRLKRNTRRLAKRQLTWFRKDPRIRWIDVANRSPGAVVELLLPMVE